MLALNDLAVDTDFAEFVHQHGKLPVGAGSAVSPA